MKPILLFIQCLWVLSAPAQYLFTSVYAGISGYQGDLVSKPIDFLQSHPSGGVGVAYELNRHFMVRAEFTYGKISGHDKYSLLNKARNLSFESNVSEVFLGIEYNPVDLYLHKVSPYFFTGIGSFKFSPYARALNGSRVSLIEMDTEGQGFYPGREPYALRQISIPLGGGIYWALSDHVRLGFVIGFRKTFTDYLDDVSTTYIDEQILAQNRGSNALNYAFRGDEIDPTATYPADGSIRGNPKNKDWYHFSGLSLRFRLSSAREKKEMKQFRDRGRTDCPF